MFSTEKSYQKYIRIILDVLNVLLGLGIVVFAILAFLNTEENMWMFPIIFGLGALMNCLTGIKHLMNGKKANGIIAEVVAGVFVAIAIFSYHAVGGF